MRYALIFLAGMALSIAWESPVTAGEVDIELATEPDFPATDVQRWHETLTKLKVGNLKIRSARGGDKIEVVNKGTKAAPIWSVHGVIRNNGEMQVPGGRFKMSDRAGMSRWIEEMRTYGPQGAPDGKPLYGMNADQFAQIKEDLSRSVDFPTKGIPRLDALERIKKKVKLTMYVEQAILKSFDKEDKIEEDLQGMSCGTALAYLLRPSGLAMKPERLPSGELRYVIGSSAAITEPWPVGWPLEKRRQEIAPQMFEMIDVDIEPVSLSTALEVIGERIQMPVILDKNNLVKHEVNIDELKVSFPAKKSTYSIVLTRLLGQARLTSDVRVDENDKPFLWVTTLKK